MQMNNLWKRVVSLVTAAMLVFTSGVEAFAGTSMEEALNKVNLYVKQEKGPQLLTWKGIVDAENFAPAIVAYQTEDGQELPAYCANPNRPGVEDTAAKAYEVDVDQLDTDPHVWGVITNGYPYKSPAELGVKTDYEAYYITKMAVWAIVHDNYSNLDDWKANGSQYDYVEKAMKELVETGRANQHVYPTWLATNPVTATAQPDGDYLVQEYEINSNANVESFRVVFDGDVPAGVKAVDENGQEKETFDGNTSKIKVMIPKTGEKRKGTFKVILKAKLENKSVMFGVSHASKQDYYVAPVPVYNGDSWADVSYLEDAGDNPDVPKLSKGLQILKVKSGTTQGLAGAVFKVVDTNGGVLGHYVTDKNGEIAIPDIPIGEYYIEEEVPPAGYVLDSNPHKDVAVTADEPAIVTFANEEMAELEVLKVDADTGEALAGAVIRVALDGGSDSYDIHTSASGKGTLTNLKSGTYTVTEIAAPDGYILNQTPQSVKLEPGKKATVTLTNKSKSDLVIKKYDEDTGMPLPNAEFSVAKKGGSIVYEGMTDKSGQIRLEDLDEGWYTITEIAPPKGYLISTASKDVYLEPDKTVEIKFDNRLRPSLQIMKIDVETGKPLAGAVFKVVKTEDKTESEYATDATGTIVIHDLDEAIYTVTEVKAPEGYLLEEQHKDIALEWGKTKTLVFENKARPALDILKVDEETKEPLAGAKFRVTETEGNTTSEYVTDKDGRILIENLEAKIYTVEEIAAPDGYLLEEQHKDIELEWGKTKQVVFTNKKRPALEILKIDEATKEPLARAKFRVTETEGNTTSEYVTDKDGRILIENLEAKIYTVEEIAAPDGYLLEEQHKDIELEWGKTKQVVFTNKKRPALEILKIDEATKEPLAGAKFRVTETEGNTTSEYITDKNGRILIENLEAKIYTVEEIVAPDGYLLEEQRKDVELEWGKTKQVVFTNKARPKLEILKVDKGDNNKPLAGAKFKVTETEGNTTSEYVTDKDGRILIENLEAKIYTVEEIAAPNGYILELQHKEIELEWGKTKTLVYENIKKPTLIITKTNGLTLKPIPNTTYKIEYEGEKGGVIPLGTYRTDKNGQIILTKREPGWHIITETIPAQGFQLPSNPVSRKYLAPGENAYTVSNEDTSGNGGNSGNQNKPSYNLTVTSGNDYNLGDEHVNYPLNSLVIKKTDANTSEMLEGAVFEVRKVTEDISGNSGTVIGRYRTDNSGIIVITGLEAGGYVVEEVQPPSNYLLSENSQQQAWMKADGTSIVEVVFSNYPYGNILVTKTDALTGKPLANARFKVTDGNHAAVGNSNGEYVTNESGEFLVSNVKPGSYIVTELEAPENYAIDTTPQTIQVGTDGGTYKVSFKNQPYSTLVILKKSSSDKTPLTNAEFKVTTSDGAAVGNSNGIFRTDTTGTITIPNLSKGSYVIKETKAPDGYILENNSRTVHMDYGKTYTETFENSPKASLILKKFDAETKKPLNGARFKITRKNGDILGEYTTDSNGLIQLDNMEPGWYSAVEVKAPDGYLLNDVAQDFEVTHTKTVTLEFTNEKLTALVIKKTDNKNVPLSGAHFSVQKQDGTQIGEYTTDKSGAIHLPSLDPDWYVVRETKAPDGYLLDETPKTVQVKTETPTTVTFVNKQLTALEIIKTNENGEPLAGAKFAVEKQDGQRIGEYTTDNTGHISIPTLPPDWYVVKETKAPNGYLLDATPKTVEVKTGQPTLVDFVNKKLTALEIKKTNENGEPLAGTKFVVEKQNKQRIGEYTTDKAGIISIPTLPPDWYVVKEMKAPDGYLLDETPKTVEVKTGQPTVVEFVNKKLTALEIKKTNENGEPLAGAKFAVEKQDGQRIGEYTTDNTGHINIPTLPPDWYVVRETKAPDGYLLDETPKTVEVKTGQPSVVDFVNKKLTALEIKKTNENGKPLAGAKFSVEKQDGQRIGEYTTDNTGHISIPTLPPDWYVVRETKAPDGYLLDEKPKTVEVKTGQPTIVDFVNKKLTALEIKKTNENGEPLAGAKFIVEKQNKERIGEYTTDNAGIISIPTLLPDWYVVKEIKAPDGYLLDETPKTVEVKTGQPTIVDFVNKKLTALEIKKTNENGEPLAGAKFAVEKQDGQRIGEYTTDNTGHINIPTLPPDWYVVRETKAPDGYLLDEMPKTVEVKTGQPTIVKFVNKALMALQIKKIDEISGAPLAGAEFKVTKQNGELVGEYVTEKDGLIHIPTLELGYYTISETKAPEGYILDSVPQTVEIVTGRPTEKTFSNKPMSGLKIIKLDSVTREPLEGVEFAVAKMNGEKIGTFKTDSTGQIYIQELEDGYYTVTEIKGIGGYHIDKEPKTVEVHWGKPTVLEITNDPFPALVIKKTSSKNDRPLEGVKFLITKFNGEEIGTYKTDESGLIIVEGLEEGQYLVKEIETRKGYQLDTEAKEVTIRNGKRTTLEVTNDPLSSIIIRKIDSVTKEGIYGVTFLLYDEKDNPLGQYMSDDEGYVWLDKELEPGKYKLRELKPADGYLPDDVPRTIYVKSGQTTEIIWENTPQKGQIVITKRAADFNELTGLPAGSPLAGASFEVYNTTGNLVDKFVSDSRGIAASKQLPLGVYVVKEVSAPRYYAVNSRELLAEIRHNGDIVRFEVLNESSSLQLAIQKKGPNSAAPGQTIQYELYEIANKSSVALENFYIHDRIPTDATRTLKVVTGTYSERMYYSITFKTNYRDYRVLAENLLTKNSYEYSLHPNALGLEAGEYVTDVRLEFPKASPGFHSIENMMVFCQVMPTVPKDYNIVNRADNGGRYGNEWESAKTSWNTTVWTANTPTVPLPKTGY